MTLIEIEWGQENLKMFNNNERLPTHEQLERRAYQIHLEHGFHSGNALEDWLAAENGLTELSETGDMNKSAAQFVPGLRKHTTA
jgi:hypothetical protein